MVWDGGAQHGSTAAVPMAHYSDEHGGSTAEEGERKGYVITPTSDLSEVISKGMSQPHRALPAPGEETQPPRSLSS